MRDEYLAPFWAENHKLWADGVADAICRIAALPARIGRRLRPVSFPLQPRGVHKEC